MGAAERWTQLQQRVCVQVRALVKPGGTHCGGGGGGEAKKESKRSGKRAGWMRKSSTPLETATSALAVPTMPRSVW